MSIINVLSDDLNAVWPEPVKKKNTGRKLPEVSEYKLKPISFFEHAADPSTWAAWHLGIRQFYAPHGFHQYRRNIPPNILDKDHNALMYMNGRIALLVKEGCNSPGAIAKKLGVKVSEAIHHIQRNYLLTKDGYNIQSNKNVYPLDALLDPRAVLITGEQSALALRKEPRVNFNGYGRENEDSWKFWKRIECSVTPYKKPDSTTVAYGYLLSHLLGDFYQTSMACRQIAYDDTLGIFINYGSVKGVYKKHYPHEIHLEKTKTKDGQLSLTLMRGNVKLDEFTWFSNSDMLIAMFTNEDKRLDAIRRGPEVPVFKNDEIACAT